MARTIAYLLIAVLVLAAAGVIFLVRHNSHAARYARRSRREQQAYEELMLDRQGDDALPEAQEARRRMVAEEGLEPPTPGL